MVQPRAQVPSSDGVSVDSGSERGTFRQMTSDESGNGTLTKNGAVASMVAGLSPPDGSRQLRGGCAAAV